MAFRVERIAAIPRPALFSWWSDYRPGNEDHPVASRFVSGGRDVETLGDGRIGMTDRIRLLGLIPWWERAVATPEPPSRIGIEGENALSTFLGAYLFEALDEGRTLVAFEGEIRPKGVLARMSPLGEPFVRAFVAWDLGYHVRHAERDFAGQHEREPA